jgi:hypothetical protein
MDSDFEFDDQSGYETDLNDLPDTTLTDKVVSELGDIGNFNEEVEEITAKKPVKKVHFEQEIQWKEYGIEGLIIAVLVFLFTNKSVVSTIMSLPLLSTYKKSMVFNIILALLISVSYIVLKVGMSYF